MVSLILIIILISASFAVALLDLDDFKSVNDTYGHVYGDEVLQNFSEIIKRRAQNQGIAARFGGVEFFHKTDKISSLFNAADEKLYKAKKQGKNTVIYHSETRIAGENNE